MINNKKNLIVTGNGFDLYCGLNSRFKNFIEDKYNKINKSYNSFFNYRKESIGKVLKENKNFYLMENEVSTKYLNLFPHIHINNNKKLKTVIEELNLHYNPNSVFFDERNRLRGLDEIKNELLSSTQSGYLEFSEDFKKINNYNFWEVLLVLYGSYEKSWYDIETEMSNFLLHNNRGDFIINKIQRQYDSFLKNDISNISYNDLPLKIEFLLLIILSKNVGKELSVENFIKEELFLFENKFAEFIKEDIESHTDYKYKRRKLFNKLNRLTNNHKSNVLTFNYTMSNHPHNIKKIKSVHGNIYNRIQDNHSNIIFGIDANIHYPDSISEISRNEIYSYTKTYRTLNYQFNSNSDNIMEKNIKNIIFFGHSLGDSDYSYFQSIFDYYNLYYSDVSLYFIFSPHGDNSDISSRERQSNKVTNLLKNYGNTLENKDHGQNLIHKLIIEDRLKIENLNNII